jgi:hypothetical protein
MWIFRRLASRSSHRSDWFDAEPFGYITFSNAVSGASTFAPGQSIIVLPELQV